VSFAAGERGVVPQAHTLWENPIASAWPSRRCHRRSGHETSPFARVSTRDTSVSLTAASTIMTSTTTSAGCSEVVSASVPTVRRREHDAIEDIVTQLVVVR
jgi:hypothetical protein